MKHAKIRSALLVFLLAALLYNMAMPVLAEDEEGWNGIEGDAGNAYWWLAEDEEAVEDDEPVQPGMFTDGWEWAPAWLNQKMATRTGPGTQYLETHGTCPKETEIVVYALEQTGSTTWALVEFESKGKLIRAYTGLKRVELGVDPEIAELPTATKKPKSGTVIEDAEAFFGPGDPYLALDVNVPAGTKVLAYGVDRGYLLIDYPVNDTQKNRCWVAESCVQIE